MNSEDFGGPVPTSNDDATAPAGQALDGARTRAGAAEGPPRAPRPTMGPPLGFGEYRRYRWKLAWLQLIGGYRKRKKFFKGMILFYIVFLLIISSTVLIANDVDENENKNDKQTSKNSKQLDDNLIIVFVIFYGTVLAFSLNNRVSKLNISDSQFLLTLPISRPFHILFIIYSSLQVMILLAASLLIIISITQPFLFNYLLLMLFLLNYLLATSLYESYWKECHNIRVQSKIKRLKINLGFLLSKLLLITILSGLLSVLLFYVNQWFISMLGLFTLFLIMVFIWFQLSKLPWHLHVEYGKSMGGSRRFQPEVENISDSTSLGERLAKRWFNHWRLGKGSGIKSVIEIQKIIDNRMPAKKMLASTPLIYVLFIAIVGGFWYGAISLAISVPFIISYTR